MFVVFVIGTCPCCSFSRCCFSSCLNVFKFAVLRICCGSWFHIIRYCVLRCSDVSVGVRFVFLLVVMRLSLVCSVFVVVFVWSGGVYLYCQCVVVVVFGSVFVFV